VKAPFHAPGFVATSERGWEVAQQRDSMHPMAESLQHVAEDSSRASDSARNTLNIVRRGWLIVDDALVNMRTIAGRCFTLVQAES
jgi:methyl-accepting chemotaxis protein